ncbi:AtpZ/AtpI family protein [Bartonella sp. A05]|uniref:AtpZ/AtpI family protein n=1 Tax=Bartonella sp. A05 TaxID=2967261 RepID=UPI0022A9A485|nr:AtpZ/AtpI family protein [Bartonella sp. A05]MCZ2203904.1 AtpZ/AtpI family protein [Bartonella sp. A05]
MAKGNEPIISQREAEGQKQEKGFHSEDLKGRSQNLGLALMRKKALEKQESESKRKESIKGMAGAIKLSSEFLASVVVGVVLGLGFDQLAGSLPWGLIFFLFLGFAAGILNILRSVGYIAPSRLGQHGALRQDKEVDRPNQ